MRKLFALIKQVSKLIDLRTSKHTVIDVNFKKCTLIFYRIMLCTVCLSSMLAGAADHFARAQPPHGSTPPSRTILTTQITTLYHWTVTSVQGGEVLCKITLDYPGQPQEADFFKNCLRSVTSQWKADQICKTIARSDALASCDSLAVQLANTEEKSAQKVITYPKPTVWISFKGCKAGLLDGQCDRIPVIELTGVESLWEEKITAIHVDMDQKRIDCLSNFCEIYPNETDAKGQVLHFWADSSFGDKSDVLEAFYRIIPWKSTAPTETVVNWSIGLISTQLQSPAPQACSLSWGVFAPLEENTPAWLSTPKTADDLATDNAYVYLASSLISNKVIDGQSCGVGIPAAGQPADSKQVSCARNAVASWQNRFDSQILSAAQSTGIPAQLIKRVFARESQLWPGNTDSNEVGLSHLTEPGVDTLLLWDPQFYATFCPNALSQQECDKGYGNLSAQSQGLVRGTLMSRLSNACPSCQYNVSLSQADTEINVFAHVLKANCAQTGRLLSNITSVPPRDLASYAELWKLTIANYNAGPGCISAAVKQSFQSTHSVLWKDVSKYLPAYCQKTKDYIEEITR